MQKGQERCYDSKVSCQRTPRNEPGSQDPSSALTIRPRICTQRLLMKGLNRDAEETGYNMNLVFRQIGNEMYNLDECNVYHKANKQTDKDRDKTNNK